MHPSSDRPEERRRGFSLIEMVIAIAIMAILAGAAVPFAIKALNQAREAKTRENLKSAYEAMFGARDRRVSNMRADFGFNPAGNLADLGKMTTSTAAPAPNPPPTYGLNGAIFSWGWNGPYWTGPTRLVGGVQVPVDAWGGVIQLRLVPGQGFQVISPGANGAIDPPAGQVQDDLVYPSQPALLGTVYGASPVLNVINNRSTGQIQGTYTFSYRNGSNALVQITQPGLNFTISASSSLPPVTFPSIPAGPVQIVVIISTPPATNFSEVLDLIPGASPVITYNVY